eukprot:2754003-Lingulodinium_polyedra.AAC.1
MDALWSAAAEAAAALPTADAAPWTTWSKTGRPLPRGPGLRPRAPGAAPGSCRPGGRRRHPRA